MSDDQRIIDVITRGIYDIMTDPNPKALLADGARDILDALRRNRIAVLELPDVQISEPIGETRWHYSGEVNARTTPTTKPGDKAIMLALDTYWHNDIPHLIACILSAAQDLPQETQ